MLSIRLAVLALASVVVTSGAPELRVLRTSPADQAPGEPIRITFDRPVAGGLETTVSASAYFRIEPAVAGKAEWLDPVTLAFTPSRPLERTRTYRVTVPAGLSGMDGSRLSQDYTFDVRPPGPAALNAWSPDAFSDLSYLRPTPRLRVLVESPIDEGVAARRILIDFPSGGCVVAHRVALRVAGQRAPTADELKAYGDDWRWHRLRRGAGASAADERRVVELVPVAPLPPGCSGSLVLPERVDDVAPGEWRTLHLSVRGPLVVNRFGCPDARRCPFGPAWIEFSSPVKGADVLRHVRVEPAVKFTVEDTAAAQANWLLEAPLKPREHYAIVVDSLLRDVFGQRIQGMAVKAFATSPVPPTIEYAYGRLLVERRGLGTLAVGHVNVDTLHVKYVAVPDSMEGRFLAEPWGGWRDAWERLASTAVQLRLPVKALPDRGLITGVRVPLGARAASGGTLVAVRVAGADSGFTGEWAAPIALVQVTDLAVHARVGTDQAVVWVTGVADGAARGGVAVELRNANGRLRARGTTGGDGIAVLTGLQADSTAETGDQECGEDGCGSGPAQYVVARSGDDRAVVGVNAYDPDLAPWHFGVSEAWGEQRWPMAGAAFTERGIYRPGETVHAKFIVRTGPLGSLAPPSPRDSVRLSFLDLERKPLLQRVVSPSRFGTLDAELRVSPDAALGAYAVRADLRRDGTWKQVAEASYTVAEYRPPEFVVEASTPPGALFAGDTLRVALTARYLFGAPMGRALLNWSLRREPAWIWGNDIPGLDWHWSVGGGGWWEEDQGQGASVLASAQDSLDPGGRRTLAAAVPAPPAGKPVRVTLSATVIDANRQTVTASASALVHPSEFYIAARSEKDDYVLKSGEPIGVRLLAVRPDGRHVAGVDIRGALVRREWHRVRRIRGEAVSEVGEWVADTVGTCAVRSADEPVRCALTPTRGGSYTLVFSARDSRGRPASTSLWRWISGPGFVPWDDESKLKLDLVADRPRYNVGDTATVLVAAPFTDAEAWVTVERERVIEQRRLKITAGSTALRFPITEAFVPNAFVSVIMVRGRSAKPGPLDDPGRPTLRVGYVELRVTPEGKRLAVEVKPEKPEYRPGDTARVAIHVRDAGGHGVASEVTLWAVDEGVLSLTAYRTPDPLDLIYGERGLGMRLGSNLSTVAPQVPEGLKGGRAPGGSGGNDLNGILRSRFRPTAFFLATVQTDANGDAVAAGALPDNLTTFRVMAVAVTAGDRYGKGQASMLATRPLVARPALPRFVREGDRFKAGVLVNQRAGGTPRVRVVADATRVALEGSKSQEARLEVGRGAEIRFNWRAQAGDSAVFRFDASGAGDADAVRVAIPIKEPFHPVVHTVSGVLHDTATIEIDLPDELDPARSTLRLGTGTSPLAVLVGYRQYLRIYPYLCSEQVTSAAVPLIALYRAQQTTGTQLLQGRPADDIAAAVGIISRRQSADGGIGYWGRGDWSTPWISAYAGRMLLDARDAGVPVSEAVLSKLAAYFVAWLARNDIPPSPVAPWYQDDARLGLADRVAAVDFLSRYRQPNIAAENQLIGLVPRLFWEDRLRLAEVIARRGQRAQATAILTGALAGVRVEGMKAILPGTTATRHYFGSQARPYARAVTALLVVDPASSLLPPLVEALVDRGRIAARNRWNTQDFGSAAAALAAYWRRVADAGPRRVQALDGGRVVLEATARATQVADTAVVVGRLVRSRPDGSRVLRLTLSAPQPGTAVYYAVNLTEIPKGVAVTPRQTGLAVDRSYERVSDGKPTVTAREGELIRVRLRVTSSAPRDFVVLDDPLPAGLEAVDLSLRTMSGFTRAMNVDPEQMRESWWYGSWDSGMWSPFDHKEMRDDRVVYSAVRLWSGTTTATYLARATTVGTFAMPAAHAEEMYNPGVHGRSGGGMFTVTAGKPGDNNAAVSAASSK